MNEVDKRKSKVFCLSFLIIVCNVIVKVKNWEETFIFNSLKPFHTSIKDYTFVQYTNNTQQFILVFGGETGQGQLTKDFFQINVNSGTAKKLIFNTQPKQRKGMCSTYFNKKMYIYGGISHNKTALSQLWEFDIAKNLWTQHAAYSKPLSSCFIAKHNNLFYIMGGDTANNAVLFSYNYQIYLWQSKQYTYYGLIKFNTKLWDGTPTTTTLDIQNGHQTSFSAFSLAKTPTLYMNAVCSGRSSSSSIFIYFATSKAIYRMNLDTLQINWLANIKEQIKKNDTFKCTSTNAWFFLVSTDSRSSVGAVRISYYKINDFSVNGVNDRLTSGEIQKHNQLLASNNITISKLFWPTGIQKFEIFVDPQQNLNLISNSDMKSYVLNRDCAFVRNSYVKQCFYGKTICKDNYIGYECTIPAAKCPATLVFYDQFSYSTLQSQCSGNGLCTSSGCICFSNYGGNDCSTYKRKQCFGNLIWNFPVMNCECTRDTVGGNNCQVQFCYNDCTENGVCLTSGQCTCNSQYQGSDCSIFIISFPS